MNNLSERQEKRTKNQIDVAIDGLDDMIKQKQEMMAQLNKEMEQAIRMKNDLLMAQGALFEEEEM